MRSNCKIPRRALALFLGLIPFALARADCLGVVEQSITPRETRVSAGSVEWRVLLENRCQVAYDATLTLRFLDTAGVAIHEARDQVIVPRDGQAESADRVYVLESLAERIADIAVEVTERERPY